MSFCLLVADLSEECPDGLVLGTNKCRITDGPPLLKRQVLCFSVVFAEVGRISVLIGTKTHVKAEKVKYEVSQNGDKTHR